MGTLFPSVGEFRLEFRIQLQVETFDLSRRGVVSSQILKGCCRMEKIKQCKIWMVKYAGGKEDRNMREKE